MLHFILICSKFTPAISNIVFTYLVENYITSNLSELQLIYVYIFFSGIKK